MSILEKVLGIENASIGDIELDASIQEVHSASATVTSHPVEAESGTSVISDHVRVDPLRVRIEGVVTNTPAAFLGEVQRLIAGGSRDRAKDTFDKAITSIMGRERIVIKTTLRVYQDMVLESFETTRNAQRGNALYFTATARQITTVTLKEEKIEDTKPPRKSTKSGGKKSPKEASTQDTVKASAAFRALAF